MSGLLQQTLDLPGHWMYMRLGTVLYLLLAPKEYLGLSMTQLGLWAFPTMWLLVELFVADFSLDKVLKDNKKLIVNVAIAVSLLTQPIEVAVIIAVLGIPLWFAEILFSG